MPTELVDLLADMGVAEAVCLATALFSASLVPFLLLVNADLPRFPDRDRLLLIVGPAVAAVRDAALDAAALLILLTTRPKGALA